MKRFFFLIFFMMVSELFAQTNLTDYLPANFVQDGTVDYTKYIQRGIDENEDVLLPNFPILINKNGLNLRSNQTINFQKNSLLRIEPNSEERYALLSLKNVRNVIINDAVLEGDKYSHLGRKGEWGMGINILSSVNIEINNPRISKFWGDGIYVGEIDYRERPQYKLADYSSRDISIKNGIIDDNRRNGISIISVKKILIEGTVIQNTSGTMPMAGIDIEPNNNEQFLDDIHIRDVTTKNNEEVGIKYVTSVFLGKKKKNVTISIENCKDIGSKIGFYLGGARTRSFYKNGIEKHAGQIVVKNFVSISNETPFYSGSIQKYNPEMRFDSFHVYRQSKRIEAEEARIKRQMRARGIKSN